MFKSKSKERYLFTTRQKKRRQKKFSFLWLLVSGVLTLLVLELVTRIFVDLTGRRAEFAQADSEQSLIDAYQLKFLNEAGESYPGASEQGSLVAQRSLSVGYTLVENQDNPYWKINEQGFRDDDPLPVVKPKGEIRIFILGSSTAFGYGSFGNQNAIAELLEFRLQQRLKQQQKSPQMYRPDILPLDATEKADEGLAQSENAVALRVAQDVGLNRVEEMAQRFGIQSPLSLAPGLVLGQSEVSVLEITGSYAAIANDGVWNRPHAIKRILDGGDCTDPNDFNTCREIYSFDRQPENRREAVSKKVTNTMTRMLRKAVRDGTGRAAFLGEGEAGKTGTTDNNVDLWFVGYVPEIDLVTGIWLGNDDNSATSGSSWQAATLWGKYMSEFVD